MLALMWTAAYHRAGREPPARGIEGLRGLRVGVIRGWAYGAEFDGARVKGVFTVEEVDNDLANFRKLALGRLDAVVATTVSGDLLGRQGAFASRIAAGYALVTVPIHLAVNKSDPHRALLPKFDLAIEQMRRSGELAAITAAERERAAAR
jgi:polar amino acid transport system substrate-binding protein